MNMRICCYDLVGVDSKTLIPYLLIIFILFSLCFIFIRNQIFFGTRLGFNWFRYKIVFNNTILCGIDHALVKPFITNESCTCELIKFAQQVFGAVAGDRTRVTCVTGGNTYQITTTTPKIQSYFCWHA
jgi:hypothetical protein